MRPALAGTVALVGLLSACASPVARGADGRKHDNSVLSQVAAPTLSWPAKSPDGYGPPQEVAGAIASSGVFFTASSPRDRILIYSSGVGAGSETWSLGTTVSDIEPAGPPVLVPARSGGVWYGANRTVRAFQAGSKAPMAEFKMPLLPPDRGTDSFRPPPLQGLQDIEALSESTDGRVAVIVNGASAVPIFSAVHGRLLQIVSTPVNTQAVSAAFDARGGLYIGLTDYLVQKRDRVLVVRGTSAPQDLLVRDSSTLAADGSLGVVAGSLRPDFISSQAVVSNLATVVTGTNAAPVVGGVQPLGDGRFVFGTISGLAISRAGSPASSVGVDLPAVKCTFAAGPPRPGAAASTTCATRATAISVGRNGTIWFLTQAGLRVGRIT